MRLSHLAALSFMLLASPALAQKQGTPKQAFGSYTCSQQVPCPDDISSLSSSDWAQYGNACVTTAFGVTNPTGFINDSAGLGSDGCLTSIPGSIPKGAVGSQLIPQCCVVKLPTSTCVIHCNLYAE